METTHTAIEISETGDIPTILKLAVMYTRSRIGIPYWRLLWCGPIRYPIILFLDDTAYSHIFNWFWYYYFYKFLSNYLLFTLAKAERKTIWNVNLTENNFSKTAYLGNLISISKSYYVLRYYLLYNHHWYRKVVLRSW